MRLVSLIACLVLSLAFTAAATTQEKPKTIKGQLPQGWKDLKLSKDQIAKVYQTQADFRKKRDDLENQLIALKAAERQELVKLLTPEQKALLAKLTTGETTEPKKPESK